MTFRIAFFFFVASLQGVFAMNISEITEVKASGMPVIVRTTKSHGDIVAINITARGGVTLTPQAGALDLLTATLPKGTTSFTKENIDRMLTETGAVFGIEARSDSVENQFEMSQKIYSDFAADSF